MSTEILNENEIPEKVILVGVHTGRLSDAKDDSTEETLDELALLTETAGGEVIATLMQNKDRPDPATYIGEGKLEELREACENHDIDLVIFDNELSPMQVRNIEKVLSRRVIDRSGLILDIFAQRANTKEGKIQVELAQLKYILPRLGGSGLVMSRLGAGIGTRGPGETKLETDKRHIRSRIEHLNHELDEVRKHRQLIRDRRKKDNCFMVALVGYTNAGKSSLLNKLTDADVLAENKLFATLDPTVRKLTLPDLREVMLVDTVGFIRKLPHHLIAAFKSTLEETVFADLLIHVADASNPEVTTQIDVVNMLLNDLKANDKPTIMAYNKVDLIAPDTVLPKNKADADEHVYISVKNGTGLDELIALIDKMTPGKKQRVCVTIPYNRGDLVSLLHSDQVIEDEEFLAEGTKITALVDSTVYAKIRDFIN